MEELRNRILLLIERLEDEGKPSQPLSEVIAMIDEISGRDKGTRLKFAEQVKRIQKANIRDASIIIQLLCRQAFEDGIRQGEREFADALILEADPETAEWIRQEVAG